MNTILLEHQTPSWYLMYNPTMTLTWLQDFLSGAQSPLDCADYRLHATPGDALIEAERGEAVLHKLEQTKWPWQATGSIFKKEIEAIQCLEQHSIRYATPWLFAMDTTETSIKRDYLLLRDFIHGVPVSDYYHQHNSLTPELISLAANICLLIRRLAQLGFNVSDLRADDLVYKDEQIVVVNWWRLLPIHSVKSDVSKLHLSEYFRAWQERVDFYDLFTELFKRIGVKIEIQED